MHSEWPISESQKKPLVMRISAYLEEVEHVPANVQLITI